MTGKNGAKKRLWRSDDDCFDAQSVQARTVGISSDGRRIKTTVNRTCARVEDSARTDWQHCFQPSIADQQYLPQGRRRYVNSVRMQHRARKLPDALCRTITFEHGSRMGDRRNTSNSSCIARADAAWIQHVRVVHLADSETACIAAKTAFILESAARTASGMRTPTCHATAAKCVLNICCTMSADSPAVLEWLLL